MSRIIELHVLREGEPVHVQVLSAQPLSIGRAPTNDLVLPDAQISWNHLSIWTDEEGVWVQDLGSSNGTFVNGERVQGRVSVDDSDLVRVGPLQELRIIERTVPLSVPQIRAFVLEDQITKLRFPIRSDRFVIGSAPHANLNVADGPHTLATLIIHGNGEIWLGTDDGDQPVELAEPFQLGDHRYQILEVDPTRAPTVTAPPDRYQYRLQATLNGATGPVAELSDPASELHYVVTAGNRATLLYLLGRQVADDIQASKSPDEKGWCADQDVAIGIWGRAKGANNTSGLHVLIHRTRQELKAAGFDPWFIEKRRRYVRVRVIRADVD
ncbi:MAG: FHA domain-containing protein [Alphaproteobacteria bacterium]|nr:FHA domain-containing protein [Alphaproteobacteria bacterium]